MWQSWYDIRRRKEAEGLRHSPCAPAPPSKLASPERDLSMVRTSTHVAERGLPRGGGAAGVSHVAEGWRGLATWRRGGGGQPRGGEATLG